MTLGKDPFKTPEDDKNMNMMKEVFKKFGFKYVTNSNVVCNSLFQQD